MEKKVEYFNGQKVTGRFKLSKFSDFTLIGFGLGAAERPPGVLMTGVEIRRDGEYDMTYWVSGVVTEKRLGDVPNPNNKKRKKL